MSRAQKIIRDISFESAVHDIYNPCYSSDGEKNGEDLASVEHEEAAAEICDERISELNPCDDSTPESDSFSEHSLEKGKLVKVEARL